jgi:hypothetical protein
MKIIRKIIFCVIFNLCFIYRGNAGNEMLIPDLSDYQYYQTKDLVRFVYNAALQVNELGKKAFPLFRKPNSKWFNRDRYIIIYGLDGKCYVDPINKARENKNLIK